VWQEPSRRTPQGLVRPTDKIGWSRTREAAYNRIFTPDLNATIRHADAVYSPVTDAVVGRVGTASISRQPPLETR
jgi:hypothetical protein